MKRVKVQKVAISHLLGVTIALPSMFVKAYKEEKDKGKEEKGESTKAKHQWLQVLPYFLEIFLKNFNEPSH